MKHWSDKLIDLVEQEILCMNVKKGVACQMNKIRALVKKVEEEARNEGYECGLNLTKEYRQKEIDKAYKRGKVEFNKGFRKEMRKNKNVKLCSKKK